MYIVCKETIQDQVLCAQQVIYIFYKVFNGIILLHQNSTCVKYGYFIYQFKLLCSQHNEFPVTCLQSCNGIFNIYFLCIIASIYWKHFLSFMVCDINSVYFIWKQSARLNIMYSLPCTVFVKCYQQFVINIVRMSRKSIFPVNLLSYTIDWKFWFQIIDKFSQLYQIHILRSLTCVQLLLFQLAAA